MPLSTPVRNFFLSRDIFINTQYVNKGVYCKTYCLDGANKSVISTLIFFTMWYAMIHEEKYITAEWCQHPVALCSAFIR